MFEIKSQVVRSTDYLQAANQGCKRVVCASGGNGGLAAAYAARLLNLPATIVLPTTTPDFVAEKLRDQVLVVAIYIIHVPVLPHSQLTCMYMYYKIIHSSRYKYMYIVLQNHSQVPLCIYMYYKIIHSSRYKYIVLQNHSQL